MCARRAAWHGSTVACRTMGNNKYTLTTCYSIASAIMWKLAIIGPGVRGSLLIGARECHRSRRFYCPHLNNDRNMSSKKVEEKESGASSSDGDLVNYIKVRCQRCFKHVKPENFQKGFDSADNKKFIAEFAESERSNVLFFSGDNIKASLGIPNTVKGKMLYFLKPQGAKIKQENMATELRCGELSNETLLNLEKVLQEVYVPVLTNPANQDGWGEVMAKNVTDGIHTFLANVSITLANTKGETSLPMPPMSSI